MSGPATRRILEREYRQYGKPEYERLATISVAHLYNLRQQPRYRERRLSYTRTRPTAVSIGERRCKSFVFIANLRSRAYQTAQEISQSLLLDMGIAIHSAPILEQTREVGLGR